MKSLYISAAHKSSGKTTVSIGLSAALTSQGYRLQTYKKGPDYIDPKWLEKATARPCYNLDFHTMSHNELMQHYRGSGDAADLCIIEGNKGLYDGMDLHGTDSNAALAKLLEIPVLLVIDCSGITRGVAPLLRGYQEFDDKIRFAGVIMNKVAGPRHEDKLRAVIHEYTDLEILGAVGRNPELEIKERHLGLIPSNEEGAAEKIIARLREAVIADVNLEQVVEKMAESPLPPQRAVESDFRLDKALSIGIVRDAAFGFYYPDDLEAFQQCGARLVYIDALRDNQLPEIDALFIGGGFPETHAAELSANTRLMSEIRNAIEAGMPTYAECGGLMYLSRSIQWQGRTFPMAGLIQADAVMLAKPVGRGYAKLEPTAAMPWQSTQTVIPGEIPAHEFHYSRLENVSQPFEYAYKVARGTGIDGQHDGIIYKNLLANYAHLRDTDSFHWTQAFLAFISRQTA
jgi:cobyrinic acid a,c-diamide synthase